jgi:hypothetical protein
VRYHRVEGASPDRVVRRGADGLLEPFVTGARVLEREGVGAITTSCGFLVKFQRELAAAVSVPVFTSSLLLVPFVHRLLAPGRRIGILTVDAASLGAEHLAGAGITPEIPIAIAGMEGEKEFTRVLLDDELELDVDLAREEHVRATSGARPACRCSTSSRSSCWPTARWLRARALPDAGLVDQCPPWVPIFGMDITRWR